MAVPIWEATLLPGVHRDLSPPAGAKVLPVSSAVPLERSPEEGPSLESSVAV